MTLMYIIVESCSYCSVPSLYHQWNNFHGVTMSTFAKILRTDRSKKPEVMQIKPEDLLGTEILLGVINLKDVQLSELDLFEIQHVVGEYHILICTVSVMYFNYVK